MTRPAGASCLHGEYAVEASAQSTSRPMPRAIHVRLSEEALNAISSLADKGKGKAKIDAGIVFSENESVQTLTIASTIYQLTRSAETQPHEIYASSKSSEPLQPVGRLSHKLIVQHRLGSSMSSRVRERNEAAIHERGDRRAIALDYDSSGSTGRSSNTTRVSKGLTRPSASPGRTESARPRHSNLLVASHPAGQSNRRDRRSGGHLSPSNLQHSISLDVEDIIPGSEAGVDVSVTARKGTSSSSTDTNSSLALSSHSPGTSISSVDSPPSKIGQNIESSHLEGLGITETKALAQPAASYLRPVENGAQTAGKRKRENADEFHSPDSGQAATTNRIKRSSGPKANARTAGGARLVRPVSSSKAPLASKEAIDTASSGPVASELPTKRRLMAEDKATLSVGLNGRKQQHKGPQNWYTSSEAEEDEDADGEVDHDHPHQPSMASGASIRSNPDYLQYRSQFTSLHAEYIPLRNELLEQRRLIQALIQGDTLSALERQNIRSKNEISIQVQKVQDTRNVLVQLKRQIWAYAEVA